MRAGAIGVNEMKLSQKQSPRDLAAIERCRTCGLRLESGRRSGRCARCDAERRRHAAITRWWVVNEHLR